MANQLAKAIFIACTGFLGKVDKGGHPYILHCLRVMHKLHTDDEDLNIIAVLHDLVEDCPEEWSFPKLQAEGFSKRVLNALVLLTHDKEVPYDDYIKAISHNHDATMVKMADLRDNSNITRLKGLTKSDFDRMEKYQRAYTYLSKL